MVTRDLKAAYRSDEDMSLDERAEAQRQISEEYRGQWKVYDGFTGQSDTQPKRGPDKPQGNG